MTKRSAAPLAAEVIVIGGGPGGSTAATALARKGHRVLLFERERFPRAHIGESLLPASLPVLDALGVLPAVEREGFVKKYGATMVWGTATQPWSWYFRETNTQYPHAYQVWRPRFDQILLDNARAHGVDVREQHTVVEVIFDGPRATGVRFTDAQGTPGQATAECVIDASGQHALLGRRLGLRRWDPFFRNAAVYGYFAGARRLPGADEGNILVESYPHGWFWNIPLSSGLMSVGAVVDADAARQRLAHESLRDFLREQISSAPHSSSLLRAAELVDGPFVVRDWSYVADRLTGPGYVLVGDAACFVDPLFSSGVHLALTSGTLAAAYVTSALRDPSIAEPAGAVYRELYLRQYGHFRELAALFYQSNRSVESYFWEARRIVGASDEVAPREAFIRAVAGQPPFGYERVVLERGQAPDDFLRRMHGVESERRERAARFEAVWSNPNRVPVLAEGVRLERKPVLDDGQFRWGEVLVTPGYPDGLPCSPFISLLLRQINGHTSLDALLTRLGARTHPSQAADIERAVLHAIRLLYIDGTITPRDAV